MRQAKDHSRDREYPGDGYLVHLHTSRFGANRGLLGTVHSAVVVVVVAMVGICVHSPGDYSHTKKTTSIDGKDGWPSFNVPLLARERAMIGRLGLGHQTDDKVHPEPGHGRWLMDGIQHRF